MPKLQTLRDDVECDTVGLLAIIGVVDLELTYAMHAPNPYKSPEANTGTGVQDRRADMDVAATAGSLQRPLDLWAVSAFWLALVLLFPVLGEFQALSLAYGRWLEFIVMTVGVYAVVVTPIVLSRRSQRVQPAVRGHGYRTAAETMLLLHAGLMLLGLCSRAMR